jgi:hypothetical protein
MQVSYASKVKSIFLHSECFLMHGACLCGVAVLFIGCFLGQVVSIGKSTEIGKRILSGDWPPNSI